MKRGASPSRELGFTILELAVVAAIIALMILALAPFVKLARERSSRMRCADNIREISLALHAYAAEHEDAFPPGLGDLYPNYLVRSSAFDCPASKAQGSAKRPDYSYAAGLSENSDPKGAIVADLDGNHGKSGKNILRIDGSIEWIGRR